MRPSRHPVASTAMKEVVIGIDLGTTYSCVAVMGERGPVVIENRGGYKTTPSMVAVTETGKRLVGHLAKNQAVTNAENTVYAAKRLIGRRWGSPQVNEVMKNVSYKIAEGPNGDVRVVLRDKSLSLPEVSAVLLADLRAMAEDHLGEPVRKAVITVPAYFNDNQRQATRDAGEIAGLDVIRILNEPTAAALSYGYGKAVNKTIAVFDLGGGTFDVSVLELGEGGVFRVVATAGDSFLGGEDFDNRIVDSLIERFRAAYDVDLRDDRMALQRLKTGAEKAKCELSSVKDTEINLPFITSRGPNEPLHLQESLTRAEFERLTVDLVERTVAICERTLAEASLTAKDVDEVLLVGGMTRMPRIQAAVTALFEREPNRTVHPDEAVAVGACLQAASLTGQQRPVVLLDVTPQPLGLLTVGNVFEELIAANTPVPTQATKVFTTSRDNQTAVKLVVVQGGSNGELLGEFVMNGLRSAPKNTVEIEVVFSLNADGIMSVSAKDLETGKEQTVKVTASSGLSKEELRALRADSEQDLVATRDSEALAAARQEFEKLLSEVEGLRPKVEAAVRDSDFGRDAAVKAQSVIEEARATLGSNELRRIKDGMDPLTRTLRMFRGIVPR